MEPAPPPLWKTKTGLALIGFLAIAGFFLVTEHTVHVFGVLPFLLLMTCPLMHLFHHHGHQHSGTHPDRPPDHSARSKP